MPAPARVLVLGVDAGDKDLILQWARDGRLPTFRSLLEAGTSGLTVNPEGLYVGAVWPSFWTGLSPARHGRYCYRQFQPGTYECRSITAHDTKGEAFWVRLSRAGRRVAVIDAPKAPPVQDINGIQISGWGLHDAEPGFGASPPSLMAEIESRFGRHPVGRCDGRRKTADEFKSFRDGLLRGVERRTDLASFYLQQGGWDLFHTVFAESHCVGHQCWHIHDPDHPRHDAEIARSVGDPIQDVYVAIDAAIGRLLQLAGDDCCVVVLASHGMGPHYDGTFLLDEILRRREGAEVPAATRGVARSLEFAWEWIPRPARRALRGLRTRTKRHLGEAVPQYEHAGRRCFEVPNNDVYGGIRVNVVGREPRGRVRPGADYDRFCEELSRDLLELVNVDSGRPVVSRVLRAADIYAGEFAGGFPDLLVEWERTRPITTVYSPKVGRIHRVFPGSRTGDHKLHGLFVARGPSIARGASLAQPVAVTRFAPTLTELLGVSLPSAEGGPVPEIAAAGGRLGRR